MQATYLFGGRDTLEASGLTYAEYARRGFFELLAVAMVVGALVLALEAFVARRSRAYLVGIVRWSVSRSWFWHRPSCDCASTRTHMAGPSCASTCWPPSLWLAIGAAGAVACIALDRTRWLPHGLVMLSVAFGLAFNVIGPVRFIAEQNIARLSDPNLAR